MRGGRYKLTSTSKEAPDFTVAHAKETAAKVVAELKDLSLSRDALQEILAQVPHDANHVHEDYGVVINGVWIHANKETTELCGCENGIEQDINVLAGGTCDECGEPLLPCSYCSGCITGAPGQPNCTGGGDAVGCPFYYIKVNQRREAEA